ncbi:lipase family protein [Patescibacteria group bacterium]|nr:lipase family protein [Patescibacteria group bacterium]
MNWNDALRYARLIQIAEGVSPKDLYGVIEKDRIYGLGYTYLQGVFGNDFGGDLLVSFGFLAISNSGELVVAIRGTADAVEWLDDARFALIDCPIPNAIGRSEAGFSRIYQTFTADKDWTLVGAIQGFVDNGRARSVTICGHSLGAALSSLLALDVAINTHTHPAVYLIATPNVFDGKAADLYNDVVPATFRIFNQSDPVPKVPASMPPLLGYIAVGQPCELPAPTGGTPFDIFYAHHLTTYLNLITAKLAA